MSEESLKNKTVKGVAWSGIDNVAQMGVSFVVGVVLARILSPDDYGLIGIVGIFTSVCNTLITYGFSSALIRKKDVTEDDYSTIFVLNLLMSITLYGIIYLSAPFIARFFGRQELVSLTRVSGIGLIIGALALVQQTRLTKKIDFKTQTIITLAASISSGIVGIVMAVFGCGVWSLVVQGLVLIVVRTVLFWIYNHWIPSLHFSRHSFNELFGFGWKLMLSSLLDSIWKELYQVVVGKYYSSSALGQYTRAKHFSQLFSTNLTNVIQRVSYPVLSDIQGDHLRMLSAYRRIIKITMFVTLISMFSLGAVSEPLLYCLIGPQWNDAARFLPLICISGAFYPLHAINLNMLQLQGRSDIFLILEIIKKIIAIAPLCVGAFIGIMPMLYVNIVTSIIAFFLNSSYSGKLIGYNSFNQLKDIAPSFGISVLISVPVFFLKYLPVSNWLILPFQVLLGIILFFVISETTKLEEYTEIKGIINNMLIKRLPFVKHKNSTI